MDSWNTIYIIKKSKVDGRPQYKLIPRIAILDSNTINTTIGGRICSNIIDILLFLISDYVCLQLVTLLESRRK